MDPLTQGALGAAWAQPSARGSRIVAATVIGWASAMSPDLDLMIRSSTDPLLGIELHRHFTHSFVFIPFGALICTLILYPLFKAALPFRACYGFSVLGFASHGLLDACTSYGTLLFWPFSRERIAWDLVSVIDPIFTVPLLVLVGLAAVKRRPSLALIGVGWCIFYLGVGFVQSQRAVDAVIDLAMSRGHAVEAVETKPSLANVFLWKSIYSHEGRYYIDAVRVGLRPKVFEGEQRPILDLDRDFPWLDAESQQATDIERFSWFADGYLAVDPDDEARIIDLRYSLVPNRADGYWGIELDANASRDAHAAYVTMRARTFAESRELLRMLFR